MQKVLTGLIGFASGSLVAGGVVALMVGLGIITRFIGISHTARHAKIYETFICMGGIAGNLVTVYFPILSLGWPGLLLLGLFCGIFVGGWIMALAELLNLTKGTSWIVVSLALGKTLGSLMQFYKGW